MEIREGCEFKWAKVKFHTNQDSIFFSNSVLITQICYTCKIFLKIGSTILNSLSRICHSIQIALTQLFRQALSAAELPLINEFRVNCSLNALSLKKFMKIDILPYGTTT